MMFGGVRSLDSGKSMLRTNCFSWISGVLFGFVFIFNQVDGAEYYGKLIGNFNSYAHKVGGTVYAVDDDTIFIKGFSYDGLGPDGFFWVGKTSQPSPNGVIVPYPDTYTAKDPPVLRDFDREDVVLQLPPGYKLKDIKWVAVWCRRFTVNFGEIFIPSTLEPPQRKVLPEFKRLAHGLRSGNITILDAKTFYIPALYYDGAGPDAFFWVGNGNSPHSQGKKIPNEKGSTDVLRGYEGEDIELTLPGDLTVFDINWIGMWCIRFKQDFGHVIIPSNLNVPPFLGQYKAAPNFGPFSFPRPTTHRPHSHSHSGRQNNKKHKKTSTEFRNCKELAFSNQDGRKIQIQWEKDGDDVKFKLTAKIKEEQYVALGFSPVKGRTKMVGADAIVVYYTPTERRKFHAEDYYLTAQSQCDGKDGACPDARINGVNDVTVIDGDRRNGFTTVVFKRPIKAREPKFDISLDEETNIMVAIGTLSNRKEAHYHFGERTPDSEDIRISVHSTDDHTCLLGDDFSNMKSTDENKLKPWPPAIIEGVSNFTAKIGPTGGNRGYSAITGFDLIRGQPSWGIAWYINDLLIPEIYVERGKTYNFIVEGGDESKNPARYHPLYITDSIEGGFGQKKEYEQRQQKVFAGVAYDTAGFPYPTAAGRYCEYEHKSTDKSAQSETFEDYMKTLRLYCDDASQPAVLTWTVADDTPDLVYYQCYTHNNLGWKIHVENPGFRQRRYSASPAAVSSRPSQPLLLMVIIPAIYAVVGAILRMKNNF